VAATPVPVPEVTAATPIPVPAASPAALPEVPAVPVAPVLPVLPAAAVPAAAVPAEAVPAVAAAVAPTTVTPLPFYVDAAATAAAQAAAAALPKPAVVAAPVDLNYKPQKLPFAHAIIGYWGTGANTPVEYMDGKTMEGPTVADALLKGYNVINVAYADQLTVNGSFQLHTDLCPEYAGSQERAHECAPHKDVISRAANMTSASWRYLLSFGGKNGAAPHLPTPTLTPNPNHNHNHNHNQYPSPSPSTSPHL